MSTAFALVGGDRTYTFGELHDRVKRLAQGLTGLAEPGDRVAILAQNICEFVECYYGVPAAGMVLTFLNFRLHPREWAWILEDAGSSVLIVEEQFLPEIMSVLAELTELQVVVIGDASHGGHLGYEEILAEPGQPTLTVDTSEDDIAWLVYTSGTTGKPKGAALTHRNLNTAIVQSALEFETGPDDRNLVAFPLCHIAGYVVPRTHLRGGAVVLLPTFDAERFMQLVQQYRITSTALAPTMMIYLLRHERLDDYDLSTLRAIGYGSANTPVDLLRRVITRFGPVLFSGFGMTELAGDVLVLPRDAVVRGCEEDERLLESCGRPMCLAEVRIVDDEFRECPVGVVGEIVVRSDQVMQKYWHRPDATVAAFRDGWFMTGDLATHDSEGYLRIADRKKDMIISGGENVYPREVEQALGSHAEVIEAAVVGVPDDVWGERVAAAVVLEPGTSLTADELIRVCRARLAGYKTPKQVLLLAELPKNGTGKVLKDEVRRLFAVTDGPDPVR